MRQRLKWSQIKSAWMPFFSSGWYLLLTCRILVVFLTESPSCCCHFYSQHVWKSSFLVVSLLLFLAVMTNTRRQLIGWCLRRSTVPRWRSSVGPDWACSLTPSSVRTHLLILTYRASLRAQVLCSYNFILTLCTCWNLLFNSCCKYLWHIEPSSMDSHTCAFVYKLKLLLLVQCN